MVAGKKECFALDDRPAHNPAKLMPLQRVSNRREEVSRVESVVAEKLKCRPVEIVASGFRDHIYNATRLSSVVGRQRTRLHFEFADCIRKRQGKADTRYRIHVEPAIDY